FLFATLRLCVRQLGSQHATFQDRRCPRIAWQTAPRRAAPGVGAWRTGRASGRDGTAGTGRAVAVRPERVPAFAPLAEFGTDRAGLPAATRLQRGLRSGRTRGTCQEGAEPGLRSRIASGDGLSRPAPQGR